MTEQWRIGLDAWIIQDGNYRDFEVGQRAEFAVEFSLPEPEIMDGGPTKAASVGDDSMYDIRARVVALLEDAWVLDCGLLVYQEAPPPSGVEVDDWIEGRAWLGVDPYFYFERLAHNDQMPALVYSWSVDAVHLQAAPFVETSTQMLERDPTKLASVQLPRTDAWNDDDGHGSYCFLCTLLDVPTKRQRNAAP